MNAIGAPVVLNFDHCTFHLIIHFYFKNVQFLTLPTLPYKYDHCALPSLDLVEGSNFQQMLQVVSDGEK